MKSLESYIAKDFRIVILFGFTFFYTALQTTATPVDQPVKNNFIIEENNGLTLEIVPSQIICVNNSIDVKMKVRGVDTNFPVQVLLYNTIGNLVYRMDLSLDKTDIQFQFKPQTKITEGLYFVSVLNGTNRVTRRMVVNTQE
ncbi:hypothetical protein [Flammeovirga aprica]|uniref:Secretion system C-terminal sorting domain-containing protein n=1 Tax=Flammeovirga aprica JL-4 TaxID=694437 RepID=A0A7X9RRP4_9BACT|nr:hypothetical protein [Flammeovirga aprica]NME66360.1 hypothetical protein [Flammeovirga aprica JL-4]